MFRHVIRSRSGVGAPRSISTPQHSDGYSASACAWTRPNSSGVRIIRPRSDSPAREGWPAAREGRNNRNLVPILERGLEPLQCFDGLVVHVDVDVVVHLALIVAHQPLERPELLFELVE